MSEFLKRYVETSVFAAVILLFSKLLGVWIALIVSGVTFSFSSKTEVITSITLATAEQVQHVTFIADSIFVALLVLIGTGVLVKTLLFNDLVRHPRILVKVIHHDLTGWLEDGHAMYPKLFAWGTFIWLAVILVIKDYVDTGIPVALPLIAGIFAIVYTYQVFSFLDTHISNMISYLYGSKRKLS